MRPGIESQTEAYQDTLKGKGAINRVKIYKFIAENPGCTRREIANALNLYINTVTPQVTNLLAAGSIRETGTKICQFSGCKAATLTSTNNQK